MRKEGEGKGRKHLKNKNTQKGNIRRSLTSFFAKEIFGVGKNIFRRRRKTEKGKEENIWRRKNIFGRRGKTENENEESIWRRKYFFWEERKNGKAK